jgi:hypothetical protein
MLNSCNKYLQLCDFTKQHAMEAMVPVTIRHILYHQSMISHPPPQQAATVTTT